MTFFFQCTREKCGILKYIVPAPVRGILNTMKKADWLVIFLAAALSALPLLPLFGKQSADTVTVRSHGETVYIGALSKDAVIELPGNTIVVANGAVTMQSADCPDGTCMKTDMDRFSRDRKGR